MWAGVRPSSCRKPEARAACVMCDIAVRSMSRHTSAATALRAGTPLEGMTP